MFQSKAEEDDRRINQLEKDLKEAREKAEAADATYEEVKIKMMIVIIVMIMMTVLLMLWRRSSQLVFAYILCLFEYYLILLATWFTGGKEACNLCLFEYYLISSLLVLQTWFTGGEEACNLRGRLGKGRGESRGGNMEMMTLLMMMEMMTVLALAQMMTVLIYYR